MRIGEALEGTEPKTKYAAAHRVPYPAAFPEVRDVLLHRIYAGTIRTRWRRVHSGSRRPKGEGVATGAFPAFGPDRRPRVWPTRRLLHGSPTRIQAIMLMRSFFRAPRTAWS